MPYTVKVDRQGRVVLPIEIRRNLGIDKGGSIILKKKDNRIYIDVNKDLEDNVERWKKSIKGYNVVVKTFEKGESKWLSEDWVKKKLGIQG